jgi:hypothetical protein
MNERRNESNNQSVDRIMKQIGTEIRIENIITMEKYGQAVN